MLSESPDLEMLSPIDSRKIYDTTRRAAAATAATPSATSSAKTSVLMAVIEYLKTL